MKYLGWRKDLRIQTVRHHSTRQASLERFSSELGKEDNIESLSISKDHWIGTGYSDTHKRGKLLSEVSKIEHALRRSVELISGEQGISRAAVSKDKPRSNKYSTHI